MVGGEWVVLDRAPTHVDLHKLAAEARIEAERLWQRLEGIEAHEFDPKGGRRWQPAGIG
jgi:hypothetical protein